MLDLKRITREPELIQKTVDVKGGTCDVESILELDGRRKMIIKEAEKLKAARNKASEKIAKRKKAKQDAHDLIDEMKNVSAQIKAFDEELTGVQKKLTRELLAVPNVPAADVPDGYDETANEEVSSWGTRKEFPFAPKPHWDIGKGLDILDFERAGKMAGAGFTLFKGLGAKLERALIGFMLDFHVSRHGYCEISPPFLANRRSMTGTGQLPKLADDMYLVEADDLFLIPTAEVPLTNLHADEILSEKELPRRYTAFTACFRREAGSYGKDTRGMVRVHQFDKVELVKFAHPDRSYEELETLVRDAEAVLQALGLEYRVTKLCKGELSFAAAKCYDIEIWAPGVGRYLEVSSCSNFEDFQARRANIRFRGGDGKLRFVHTLNGSGVACPRLVVALLETGQNEDGSVTLPDALAPYMGGVTTITAPEG